jgi:hypothetical protein
VTLKRLGKQFRRELTKNPKKAAFLGLLVVVALYFWAPLVWGWVAKSGSTAGNTPAATVAGSPAGLPAQSPTAASPTPGKNDPPTLPWQQVVKLMDSDPRTLAADMVVQRSNPFAPPKTETPKLEPKPEPETTKPALAMTAQGLGLVLSSTIIGPSRRVARINGKTFEQGQTIEVLKDGQHISLTLSEVQPRRVVLTRDSSQVELTIPDPIQSKRIEFTGKAN